MIRALAITVSNRASAGVYEDRSGPVLVELLRTAGCDVVDGPLVIPDGEAVEQVLRDSVTAGYDVAVTTGGTGLTPTDQTPEMTRRVIDREIPGIAEALRSAGAAAGVPSAILSRGLAGIASRTLIVNLPGSSGGVRDGMNVLRPILVHAVDQIRGGDHVRTDARRQALSWPGHGPGIRTGIALRFRLGSGRPPRTADTITASLTGQAAAGMTSNRRRCALPDRGFPGQACYRAGGAPAEATAPRLDGLALRGMINSRGTHPRVAGHPNRAGPAGRAGHPPAGARL